MRVRTALVLGAAGLSAAMLARRARNGRGEDLQGKVVLITGGSRGLGFLLAREFGKAGCHVSICARNGDGLKKAQTALRFDGLDVHATECDVGVQEQVQHWVREAMDEFGHVDVLVNNAGVIQVGPIESQQPEDFHAAMGVMFWGTVYPTLAVLPQMTARRSGRIVNVTSIGAEVSVPHLLPYNSAKFAARGFSEGLRAEMQRYGVKVVTVVPGLMRTGSYLQAFFKGQQEKEFTWFALGASLPIVSMDAERAAQQIVEATRRGQSRQVLSLPAEVLSRMHGLMPGLTSDALGLVNRVVLPKPLPSAGAAKGLDVQEQMHNMALQYATRFGRAAGKKFGEYTNGHREAAERSK